MPGDKFVILLSDGREIACTVEYVEIVGSTISLPCLDMDSELTELTQALTRWHARPDIPPGAVPTAWLVGGWAAIHVGATFRAKVSTQPQTGPVEIVDVHNLTIVGLTV